MLFSSVTFLFFFLPLVFGLYYVVPKNFKNYVLLFFSIVFYAWGGLLYLPLLLISIFINYIFGLKIGKYQEDIKSKKRVLIISIIFNILFLGVFKYTNFIVDNINILFNTSINAPIIPLPIGISFYTFQAMSYVIDVYKNDGNVQKNIFNLALYISMFPQLVAGPIVRYQTVDDQISSREHNFDKFNSGMERFIRGLFKKVIISNTVGELSTIIYGLANYEMSVATAWLGAIAYTLQIYFDFSGYSDMAIGLAKMFGFDFLENFDYPYISKSITEFWRRWHMSLGGWFREYIYIPLGGNKKGTLIQVRNLFIVWFTTGLWHGASTNFVVWGLYFGVILFIEKIYLKDLLKKIPSILSHIYTLIIVMIGWVIFDMNTLTDSGHYIKIMFGFGNNIFIDNLAKYILTNNFIILLIGLICSTKLIKIYMNKIKSTFRENDVFLITAINLLILIISTAYLVGASYNPFLYFRF